jgi:hypothetical protein
MRENTLVVSSQIMKWVSEMWWWWWSSSSSTNSTTSSSSRWPTCGNMRNSYEIVTGKRHKNHVTGWLSRRRKDGFQMDLKRAKIVWFWSGLNWLSTWSLIIFSNDCNESSCNVTRICNESRSIVVSIPHFRSRDFISARRPDTMTDVFEGIMLERYFKLGHCSFLPYSSFTFICTVHMFVFIL